MATIRYAETANLDVPSVEEYPICACCHGSRIVPGVCEEEPDRPVCSECQDAKRCRLCDLIDHEGEGAYGPDGWLCEVCAIDGPHTDAMRLPSWA